MIADLYAELDELTDQLMAALETCRTAGCQLAENEAEYRKALRIEELDARERKVPVTIISDLCRGKEEIADLRQRRDCSEAIYKASFEALQVYKLRIRMVNEEINRVWTSGGIGDNQ